jgi:predicted SnoaL-like aldol condensation-catalyzing enzyme
MSDYKKTATSFLQAASSGDVRRAFDTYIAPNFRHHNAYFPGDAKSLADAMEQNARENPDKVLRVERAIEEGDLVAVHSRVRLKPDVPEVALVHIFRFEDGRVVELWDIGQPVPPNSPNEHGMF